MRIIILVPVLLFQLFAATPLFSQDDDSDSTKPEITMSQEEWHLRRDQYAVSAIILLRKLEKLDSAIEVLKKRGVENDSMLSLDCHSELLAMVGASKEDYPNSPSL